ncbi:MAG TPA: hypothetical protein VGU69_05060 [Rhizomicrobium sp.]|nr:hypothetical protein [Rhizomicrobium sp.]
MQFLIGQLYERTVMARRESAKVVAIVDYGRVGWLKMIDAERPPFELTETKMMGWQFQTRQQKD